MNASTGWKAGVGVVLALCVVTAVAQRADRPTPIAPGPHWVNQMQDSGSFGSGPREVETRATRATWEGREYAAIQSALGTTLMQDTAEWVAVLAPDGKLVGRWEPPIAYDWPLEVGKSSVRQYQYITGQGETMPLEYKMQVEAFEDVTVPAGTFKAFRIRASDNLGNSSTEWYSPDLKLWVKRIQERSDQHAQGAGRREMVLKSQTVRAPQ